MRYRPLLYSTGCKYAIRAITFLARHPEGAVSVNIAQECGIPPAYLSSILKTLARCKVLASSKGAGGGFILPRDPVDICLADIVRAVDGDFCWSGCALGHSECPFGPDHEGCAMHDIWQEMKAWITMYLRETTIAELAQEGERLEYMLVE